VNTCTGPACGRRRHGRLDLCRAHYLQRYRGKPLTPITIVRKSRICTFEGCDRKHRTNGLCAAHNAQRLRGQTLHPLKSTEPCGCPWPDEGHLCPPHRKLFLEQIQIRYTERVRA
jgi:hypothetical protein